MNAINGKLYQITKWHWFVYPTLNTATSNEAVSAINVDNESDKTWMTSFINQFSLHNKCIISKLSPDDCFVIINVIKSPTLRFTSYHLANILTPQGETGWIILPSWWDQGVKQVNNE